MLMSLALSGEELRYRVRHDHLFKDGRGLLVIDERGVSYREQTKKKRPHAGGWDYVDIQQLAIAPHKIVVLTYQDRPWWVAGIDREFEFKLDPGQDLSPAYRMLKDKLDQRFVAELADSSVAPVWEIAAKLTGFPQGSEGVLKVGRDRIVYQTSRKRESRTWRDADIENISTSGQFELTIVTYEREIGQYGRRRAFQFQLKQPLDERRYQDLWLRLNRQKDLSLVNSIEESGK